MYWSAWSTEGNLQDGQIVRTSMDGISSTTLFDNRSVVWPNALALDHQRQQLYWIDALRDTLSKSESDGLNHQTILEFNRTSFMSRWHVFGMDYFNDSLYFGEQLSDSVLSLSVGSPNSTLTTLVSQLTQDPGSVRIVDLLRQPVGQSEYHFFVCLKI